MATYYVRSTDGNNADSGATWALAEADLHTPVWAAGDTIYASQVHAQSTAAAITIDLNGTLAAPTKIICANDAAEPPTAVAATGTVATTGVGNSISIADTGYIYGIGFTAGSSTGTSSINQATTDGAYQVYDSCNFIMGSSGASSVIRSGVATANTETKVDWTNCGVKFAAAGQTIAPTRCVWHWHGGSILAGGTSPTVLVSPQADQIDTLIEGVDLSNGASTMDIFAGGALGAGRAIIRNCQLPASWTGDLVNAAITTMSQRYELYNCDSADTNYRLWIEDYAGSIKHSTAVYNDAGATDGTTRLSWQMVSSANAEYPVVHLESPEMAVWNDTVGSAVTATVEIVHDSQGSGTGGALKDDEVWLEVQYLGTSGVPISSFITDCKANVLATAADQASSSASWTGDAAGWDTQKLSVTFTPQEKGFVLARVILAKPSATVYVDPLPTLS